MPEAHPIRQAIVLAHGRGDDCFPYGGDKALRAKYAMEVDDVPLVRRVVDSLRRIGIQDVAVAVGYLADSVKTVFADLPDPARPRFITVEPYDHGDAPALASAVKQLGAGSDLMVANADLFAQTCEYQAVVDAFTDRDRQAVCSLVDELDPEEDELSWHTVDVDKASSKITAFNGPVAGGTLRLSGLYAVPAAQVPSLVNAPAADAENRCYLAAGLPALLGSSPVVAVTASQPVVHVDRCFDYLEANMLQTHIAADAIPQRKGVYVYRGGEGEPDPRYIFPGTVIRKGATLVFEENAFISPFDTLDEHLEAIKSATGQIAPIRIRGDVYLGARARIGPCSEIEGGLTLWPDSSVDDSLIEPFVILGAGTRIRRKGFVRTESVLMAGSRIECAADFEGTAGPGTIFMHPSQCWICNGRNCDCGAGNFFGTWRFDEKASKFLIRGRKVTPKEKVGNATFLGDNIRSAVMVNFTPGTRIGSNTLIGPGIVTSGTVEPGKGILLKQDLVKTRVGYLRK